MIYQNAIEKYLQKDNDHNPVIMTSIDEVTFVIKPTEDTVGEYPDNWQQIASSLAETISEKLSLPALFGEYTPLKTSPSGYTDGFTFQHLPYYFAIAWHQLYRIIKPLIKTTLVKPLTTLIIQCQ